VLIWFVALAGLGLYVEAQTNTGNVYGTVADEQGAGIPGGTVTLMGPQAPRTTTVDEGGRFRFLKIAPEKYSVRVTMPGFTTVTRENVIVVLGKDTQVDVTLKLSAVQEKVTVTDTTPLIDTRKVAPGATFSREELSEIPTTRDIYALIQQVPGVQIDTVNVGGNQSAVAGGPDFIAKGASNVTYLVDGSTVTDNTYGNPLARQNGGTNTFFDFDTFQNVEVTTGGSLLELQNPGVQINVVTKRGTNELKGSARYLYASKNWQSDNTSQEAIDQGFITNKTRYIREYGADAGGPIIKDKVWLWAAGSRQDISINTVQPDVASGNYASTVTLEPWSAKLNWQVSAPNSLNLYFQRSNRIENGRISSEVVSTRAPETRTDLHIPTNFYKIEDNHVFSSTLFASVFANYQKPDYTSFPKGGLGAIANELGVPVTGALDVQEDYYDGVWHNSWNYYLAKDPQRQANAQVSKFFNTGKVNHELKVSFNYRQQVADSATGWPGDQLQGYVYSASYASALVSRGVRTVYRTTYITGMLGDTLTAGNLTVNAGVRYDSQKSRNLPGRSFGNTVFPEILPTVYFHGAPDTQFSYTNWQPRASVTYALGEKKNTLARASYGRFADQLGFISYYGSGVPLSNGYYYYWTDTNNDHRVQRDEVDTSQVLRFLYDIDPAFLPNIPNQLQPGFKTPVTDEITAGLDHQIFEDFAVSGTFTYRHTKNLQDTIPIGSSRATYELLGNATGSVTAANGFTLSFSEPYYGSTLPEAPTGSLFYNRQGVTQRFYGADFSAVKRLSHNWLLRATFGWQNFTQHVPPEGITDPNNLWDLGGQNTDGGIATGYSSKGDRSTSSVFINATWQFNITGLYQFPWGISLGANFFGRQGYPNPYNVRASTHDALGSRPRLLIGELDTYRLDNLYQLDLRLEKAFKIGPVALIGSAELFNVANSNTVLQRYQRVGTFDANRDPGEEFRPDPLFNTIQETQSPRILRLGIRLSF
jgi:hypothetical protein